MSKRNKKKKNKRRHTSFQAGSKASAISFKGPKARKVAGPPMIVDGEPVRRAARQAHEKARAQMETMEQQIDCFERQELPAYQRWVYLSFGQLLAELRETELAAAGKEAVLDRIEGYQIWGNMSPVRAYAQVKSEMENPDLDRETGSADQDDDAPDFDSFAGENDEELRNIYEAASSMFEQETGFRAPDFDSFKYAIGLEDKQSKSKGNKADSESARIKKLYRKIARSLHPDCSDQFSFREQRLWHRAQEAYKAGDVVALETVLSHIEAAASGPLFALSVSDLLESTREMRTRVAYLEEDLYQARQHPGWRFSQKSQSQLGSLRKRVEKEIRLALQQAHGDLASAEAELQELEFAYTRLAARKRQARKSKRTGPSPQQESFHF